MDRWRENWFYPFRVFTLFSIAFLGGVLANSFLGLNFVAVWPVFLLVVFGLAATLFWNYQRQNGWLILINFAFFSLFMGTAYSSFFDYRHLVDLPLGQPVTVSGQVVTRPDQSIAKQKVVLSIMELNGQAVKQANILAELPQFPEIKYGDRLRIEGEITEPQNFGDFDYRGYLKKQFVFGIIKADKSEKLSENKSLTVRAVSSLYQVSEAFENSLNRIISEPHASIASGLLLGIKRNIPENMKDDLNTAGLTHIIALSGFNVTIIIAMFADSIVAWVGRRRTFLLGVLFVLTFVILTGASPSIVRAAIFSLLILFGKTFGRQGDQTNLMLLAAIVMVIFNPYVLRYDVGFQLSFLAFAGLIYLSPAFERYFEKSRLKALPVAVKSPLSQTLSAQIFVLPILIFNFGRVSLIAPFSNLLILWMIPYGMALAFAAGLLGILYQPLGQLAAYLLWPAMEYIIKITEVMASIPYASLNF